MCSRSTPSSSNPNPNTNPNNNPNPNPDPNQVNTLERDAHELALTNEKLTVRVQG